MNKLAKKAIILLSCAALLTVSVAKPPAIKADDQTPSVTAVTQETNINGVPLPASYHNRKVVGYFPNYALNLSAHDNFSITDLQWDKLTHVQYAFAIADDSTLKLVPSDANDTESTFEGREFYHKGQKIEMDETLAYKGQFNLMNQMQKLYPDVTVLASTGGWAASRTLWKVTDNEANMRIFADSAVTFIRQYGFDGIDIDFEFPSETSQSGNPDDFDLSEPRRSGISKRYSQFIKILRDTLDVAAKEDNTYYWLTSAVSASSWVLGGQTSSEFLDYLDFVSIMSYDYHGGWNNYVENQANIYADPADKETISMAIPTLGFNWSHAFYRGKVQSEKILMGVPYYTRGWTNVSGGENGLHGSSNTPATGNENVWGDFDKNDNEMPAGANPLWHVLNLMETDSNYKKYWDPIGRVPYVWNGVTKTFLTFEDEQSIQERINYVKDNNLGGVLIWVMHGDYGYDAATEKYTVGDTLTTMLHDQFKTMGPTVTTSDLDVNAPVADFEVDFGGKYDHPNYTYEIFIKNNTGEELKNWELSFDIPKSAEFASAYGSTFRVAESTNKDFNTVTIKGSAWDIIPNGGQTRLQGAIKLCFSGVKNFKLNGMAMKSEVDAEKERLARLGLYNPEITPSPTPSETPVPTDAPVPTNEPLPTQTPQPTQAPDGSDNAAQVPAVPTISHDNHDGDGNFILTWNIWWGENASTAEYYKDNILVSTEMLTYNGMNQQSSKLSVEGLAPGEYEYKVVLKNSKGSSEKSITITVTK